MEGPVKFIENDRRAGRQWPKSRDNGAGYHPSPSVAIAMSYSHCDAEDREVFWLCKVCSTAETSTLKIMKASSHRRAEIQWLF